MKTHLLRIFSNRPIAVIMTSFSLFCSLPSIGQVNFTNTDTIYIPDGTTVPIPGKPYPSQILVEKQKGLVTGITVTLFNMQHNFPDGIDLLLVAPDGTNSVILSDVGGAQDISDVTITLDDDAQNYLPDRSVISSGTYKPTNVGNDIDLWPGDAPSAFGADELSVFKGIDPNGIWRLYAVSDQDGTYGLIAGGWMLSLDVQKKIDKTDLELKNATYRQNEKNVDITWTSENEFNVTGFVVERSDFGSNWTKLADVAAQGFTKDITAYEYVDQNRIEGKYQYRVKMLFKDGSVKYSHTKQVEVKSVSYNAYPNPAKNFTFVVSDSKIPEQATVVLKDVNNNIIAQRSGYISQSSALRIDFIVQYGGVYYLVITTNSGQTAKTLYIMK